MASTITFGLFEVLPFSIQYELACGEDTRIIESSTSLTRANLDRELEIIQRIPDAVATHEPARQIRFDLNWFSLFHRLPTEVISAIFHLVVQSNMQQSWPAKHAVRISSVSQLWREIATEMCATLWTRLDALPASLLDLFLSRSGSAPLEIVYEEKSGRKPLDILRFFELVVPHIHRWRVCRVGHHISREYLQALLQQLSASAPQLEVLQFSVTPTDDIRYLNLFGGVTPQLREIYIDFNYIPMSSPIFRGLTKLHLFCITYCEPNPIDQLLGILELCPLMESISLRHLVFSALPVNPVPGPLITLRCLQKLDLEELPPIRVAGGQQSSRWVQSHFFPRIIIPTSCTLGIIASITWGDDFHLLLPQRSNFLPHLSDIQSARVLGVPRWSDRSSQVYGKMFADGRIVFLFTMKRCSRLNDADDLCAFSRTISSIGRALSLPLLEEVNLAQDEFYYCRSNPTPALESFFRTYPTIKTVKLCGHWAWGSILGLFVATPTRQLCPLLQDLWLAPAKPLNESVLLEVVKSRTTPEVDSPHLRGVVPLQRLFFGPNDERLSLSVLATLRTHVAVDFKYPH